MKSKTRIVSRVWMAGLWLTASTLLPAQTITITEYPGSSAPRAITAGPDGALWFAEGNSIGRITTTGTLTQYPVPTSGGFPTGITTGPDGTLWFTENFQSKIGQVTAAGIFNEYPIPTAGSSPFFITTGPDGALWFTEGGGNKIGRISTAGTFTEYPLPTSGGSPRGIATGPDGALWFAEQGSDKIGRITTAGVFTEYAVPTGAGSPTGITAGPDGAVWFTELIGNKIGRITTTGVVTEYPVPTAVGLPQLITLGPDGALWFTENGGNQIGRITTAGNITEYPIPTASSSPYAIAAGPDGAMWFTEASGNNIGQVAGLLASGQTVVVPNGNATAAGGDTSNLPSTPVSAEFQSVFASGQFLTPYVQNPALGYGGAGEGSYITGLSFRAAPGTGPADVILSGNVYLSTSPNYPNSGQGPLLSTTLANNVGPDNTLVFSGSATLSGAGCAGPAPCPFTNNLLFTTPFHYHGGPLLVDVQAASILGAAGHFDKVDCGAPGCSVANVAVSPLGTPTAANVSYGGSVMQFTFTPIPLPFFTGEESLGSGVYYLQFPDGNLFGYYNFPASFILYHYDMGFEAFIPGSASDIYLYDFTSNHWLYTSSTLFPYLYDFTLNTWIYYFADTKNPGHYTTNPRSFANLTTGAIFTM